MADFLANMTQVINQSPQVSSLVGGHMAAAEEAKLQAQIAESERQRQALGKTVLALDDSSAVGKSDPDARQRLETRREQRRRRQAAQRAAWEARRQKSAGREPSGPACAETPFEQKPVIDVCV